MKTGELLILFSRNKIVLVKHGRNHDKYYSPITKNTFTVPRHKDEIDTKTLHTILKCAGLDLNRR